MGYTGHGHPETQLCLNNLPAAESYVHRKALFPLETCPAVLVEAKPLVTEMHHGGLIKGPKPVVFSPDMKTTLETLRRHPHTALPGKSYTVIQYS
jgi:hypothetical protein